MSFALAFLLLRFFFLCSEAGQQLIDRCKQLLEVNQELGRQLSKKHVTTLVGSSLVLKKKHPAELVACFSSFFFYLFLSSSIFFFLYLFFSFFFLFLSLKMSELELQKKYQEQLIASRNELQEFAQQLDQQLEAAQSTIMSLRTKLARAGHTV